MEKLFTIFMMVMVCAVTNAQNPVPNSGFETWIQYATYEEPQSWGTVNDDTWTFGGNSPFTVKKDSNSHDGALAAKLVRIGHNNQVFPAVMCTGEISFSNFSCTGGFPVSAGYSHFSGYFKYSPAGIRYLHDVRHAFQMESNKS